MAHIVVLFPDAVLRKSDYAPAGVVQLVVPQEGLFGAREWSTFIREEWIVDEQTTEAEIEELKALLDKHFAGTKLEGTAVQRAIKLLSRAILFANDHEDEPTDDFQEALGKAREIVENHTSKYGEFTDKELADPEPEWERYRNGA